MTEQKSCFELGADPSSPWVFAIGVAIITSMFGLIVFLTNDAARIKEERKAIQSEMLSLAEQGKPQALLWAATRYTRLAEEADAQLKQAAELGSPEAMYLYGRKLERNGDSVAALAWYQKSASEGYIKAVMKILAENEAKNEQ